MERGDDIMPVAVNVPVVADDVDVLESPLPPQEITRPAMQANRTIEQIFFICKSLLKFGLAGFIKWIN
jgi:hypothetical protein